MVKAVVCFAKGTNISTEAGEVPIEQLKAGDILLTSGGERIPVRWIGLRHIDLRKYAGDARRAMPICIKAGAISEGIPYKNLYVSPGHALLLDGVLVPACRLLNGGTILQVNEDEVTYFHVECDRHVILVANGAAAESYIEVGTRSFFSNAPGATSLHSTMPESDPQQRLAAKWASRDVVTTIWRDLLARAEELGYRKIYGSEGAALLRPQRRA